MRKSLTHLEELLLRRVLQVLGDKAGGGHAPVLRRKAHVYRGYAGHICTEGTQGCMLVPFKSAAQSKRGCAFVDAGI